MKFLYPQFLWALLVLAIPIIIHLFNFKKYKTLYFSSLSFIKHVDQKTRSTQRLKHLLILAMRLLAFTFIVIAFAQPYFPTEKEGLDSKKSILCFYIDNSFSMQAHGPEGELLSEAREKVKDIIESSAMDTRFLIGTNEMSGREERLLNRRQAFEKIDEIQLCPLPRSLSKVLDWQMEVLKDLRAETKTRVNHFIFSDFQRAGVEEINPSKDNTTYFPTRLIPEKKGNVCIDSIWFTSPIHQIGTSKELNIRVANFQDESIENLELKIKIESYEKTVFIDVPSQRTTTTTVSFTDKSAGVKKGEINVVDEHVLFDDTYYISYEVEEHSNVFIIDGEDAITGLHIVYEINDFYNTQIKKSTEVTKEDFKQQDIVIINGVNTISSGLGMYLNEFMSTGGSVTLFPGKTPNLKAWNVLLSKNQLPLLGETVRSGNRIKTLNYADPFFDGVFESKPKDLNLPSVSSTFRAIKSNIRSTDLIILQNGLPLLSYCQSKGNAFMFYSSIHEDFGNFSRDALFTTILLRSAELSKRKQPLAIDIGSDSQFPLYKKNDSKNAIHLKGNGLDFIPQINEIGGVKCLTINKMDNFTQLLAGNFLIASNKILGSISLNYNRSESKLNYYSPKEVQKMFAGTEFEYNEISSKSALSTENIGKPFSYWKICIVLTLIFVLSEMVLVRIFK